MAGEGPLWRRAGRLCDAVRGKNYAHLKPLLARERKTDLIAKITELGEAAGARNAASAHPAAFDALTQREFEIVELDSAAAFQPRDCGKLSTSPRGASSSM